MGNNHDIDADSDAPFYTTDHIISIRDLKLCDHIYHQCGRVISMWSQHHGIVTHIPKARTRRSADTIKVHTLTILDDYAEIQEISLTQFLNGNKLRRVKYGVTAWYESLHVEGSSHRQIKSTSTKSIREIMERCNAIKRELDEMKFRYIYDDRTGFFLNESLNLTHELNDNHFAFWCSSGIVHHTIANTKAGAFLDGIEDNLNPSGIVDIEVTEDLPIDTNAPYALAAPEELLPSHSMPNHYKPSHSTGMYGVYTVNEIHSNPIPQDGVTYRPSLSTGIYGIYCIKPIDDNSQRAPSTDVSSLKLGDHIYQYPGKQILSKHHGIITFIPPDETNRNEDNIKVMEMIKEDTANLIREVSLTQFRKNRKIHKVKYGVSKAVHPSLIDQVSYGALSACQLTLDPGCNHQEQADDPQTIIQRCNEIKQYESSQLNGMTSKQFALYCTIGKMSSVNALQLFVEDKCKTGTTTLLKKGITVAKNAIEAAKSAPNTTVRVAAEVLETGAEAGGGAVAIKEGAKQASKEGTKQAAKQLLTPFAVVCLVGVSVGVEAAFTGWSIYRYNKDADALWYDTKWRIGKGWCSTVCTVAATLICMGTGVVAWPALIIAIAAGVLPYGLFKLYEFFRGEKSEKEKIFNERGLKLESSIREKLAEIRLINKQIKDERLHPNNFTLDLPQIYVKVYEFTERPFDITIKSGAKESNAIVDTVAIPSWVKGIRSGMIVYSINGVKVMDEKFENIKAEFDGCRCDETSPLCIGLFCIKKVNKETVRRQTKNAWLENVKQLIRDDIEECKRRRRGIRQTATRARSTPLAITL